MPESANDFPTTIGPDAVFKGQLQFQKGVRILGKFEGEISGDGQLVIAEGASFSGDLKADTVRIEGQVKANLTAKAKVQLSASARLEGDVQAARLEVAEGAVLVGRCTIGVNGQAKSTTAPKTAPATAVSPAREKTSPAHAAAAK